MEKDRSKQIKRHFFIADILAKGLIFGLQLLLCILIVKTPEDAKFYKLLAFLIIVYPLFLAALFMLSLVISAFKISNSIKFSTGRKQNICLLNWHIFNLFLMMAIAIYSGVFQYKFYYSSAAIEDKYRFDYIMNLTALMSGFVEMYVDIFFLWLLYRFMKPQKIFGDGKTEACALLFAHDADAAQENLLTEYKEMDDIWDAERLQKKHDDFLSFVIKDWI